jgi:hypothetical protein
MELPEFLKRKEDTRAMREFATGATRDSEDGKLDYEGFLSPLALKRYAEYMHQHRHQADGKLRDSDNWQKGMPRQCYIKSLFRHFMDFWFNHRGHAAYDPKRDCAIEIDETLCAILFNAFGYLHEIETQKRRDSYGETTLET